MRRLEMSVLILTLCGVAFSGYLSSVKFFSNACAFNETCPYFWGYPACYYGFAMYLTLATLALLRVMGWFDAHKANIAILNVAALGILFSGYFTALELPLLFSDGLKAYVMGLPSCAMGLIMYVVILVLSIRLR